MTAAYQNLMAVLVIYLMGHFSREAVLMMLLPKSATSALLNIAVRAWRADRRHGGEPQAERQNSRDS